MIKLEARLRTIEQSNTFNSNYSRQVEDLRNSIDDLKRRTDQVDRSVGEDRAKVADLIDRFANLESQILAGSNYGTQFDALQREITRLEQQLSGDGTKIHALQAFIAKQLSETKNVKHESKTDHLLRTLIDLISPLTLFLLLILFLVTPREIRALFKSLQSVRIGPVELVLAAFAEIRSEIEEGNLQFELTDGTRMNFAQFAEYPRRMENAEGLFALNVPIKWHSFAAQRLNILEARIAVQDDRIRSSASFDEARPPSDFINARSRLFNLFLCLGNFYGFALLENPTWDRPVDLEASEFYLRRAITLRPQIGEDLRDTIGYAYFCIAAVKGLLGLKLLSPDSATALTIAEGERLVNDALRELEIAESFAHAPPFQFHFKAYLLFRINDFRRSAAAWRRAAYSYSPPSPVMYFNYACALAKLRNYDLALTMLERAVSIFDGYERIGSKSLFNPRDWAWDPTVGSEFKPFWPDSGDKQALDARSLSVPRKAFEDIVL